MKKEKLAFIHKITQNSSLRTKMVLIFFVLLILPSFFFIQYASRCVASVMQEQTFSATRKTFDETLAAMQSYIDEVYKISERLVYDNLIYTMVSTDPRDYPYIHQWEDTRALSTSLNHLIDLTHVSNIRLYVKNDYIYSHENQNIFSAKDIEDTKWYQALLETPSGTWFSPLDFSDFPPAEQNLFSYMRIIYDPSNLISPLAVLRIDLSSATLERAIDRTSTTPNAAMLLLSQTEQKSQLILSAADENAVPLPDDIPSTLCQSPLDEWGTISSEGIDYYSYRTVLEPTGWQLAALIPYSDIYGVSTELRTEMILVMLLIALLAYVVALYLSNHALQRLWKLSAEMQKVEDGDVNVQFAGASRDEIGQLIAHFNHMMSRVRQLMDEKIHYGQEIKNLELKALQAQINPHFLYNTLDTINCLAIQKNAPEITDIVSSLASFYRISLSKGKDQIPIQDELRHSNAYISIQNIRFENRIKVVWDVAPEIKTLLIVKIVLQPIIENAVIHGIYEKEDSSGTITICGWREENDVYISVSDDGIGMSPQKVSTLFSTDLAPMVTPTSGGYGLQNICDRLRIAYGEKYGLACESELNTGTTITIHIPAISDNSI